jgi:hypothetical protein
MLERLVHPEMEEFAMSKSLVVLLTMYWLVAPSVSAEIDSSSLRRRAFESANKAVRLVDQTSATFLDKRKCFTCHTQTFAALVLSDAAKAGIDINENNRAAQVERAYEIYDSLGGVRPDTVGHALLALDVGRIPPNDRTEAMLRYLLDYGKENGHWKVAIENREPAEASNFTTNYLAVRAANRFGTAELKEGIAARRKGVEAWFAKAKAEDTEDQVFRLFLGSELGIPSKRRERFVRRLLDEQLAGGGWAQKAGMKPDAYATASVLVALNKAGGMSAEQERWKKGVEYLLKTQQPDGSWHVASRAKPVQEYFESGFPHGKDQFISAFATGWATKALLILVLHEES